MKLLIFIFSTFLFVYARKPHLLGTKECTWGPSYWCTNLTSAAGCHATKHCIQSVWIHRQPPPDTTSICQTCLDMVKQARDQLLSNETEDLIKQVFEGSCNLTLFKPLIKECDKIVDDFIPDLIDTLASQMNPQVVCQVAGLCNNEAYLNAIEESSTLKSAVAADVKDACAGCYQVMGVIETRFYAAKVEDVLQRLLSICGHTGSFSSSCSELILTHFESIYSFLYDHLHSKDICLLSGDCSVTFHTHKQNVQVTPGSSVGVLSVKRSKDDEVCSFCKQLVDHFRQVLTANTSEEEFKQMFEGICDQTKSFAQECRSLVDEYYPELYEYLVKQLNSTAVCKIIDLCPSGQESENIPIVPLVSVETLEILPKLHKPTLARVPLTKTAPSIKILAPEEIQLPVERILSPIDTVRANKELCFFCQYFLHYVQQALTSPSTTEEIKKALEKGCKDLPTSINETCYNFIETYEPALEALLAQEIDPSQVCPLIKACPSSEVRDVEVFMKADMGDNAKCPLCLFAVQKLEEMVKDNKTKESIENALGKLCSKLSTNLIKECQDFVQEYTEELVEMLIADLRPNEVCVFLKLCKDKTPAPSLSVLTNLHQIETNSIFDNTVNGVVIKNKPIVRKFEKSVPCVLCNTIVKLIEQLLHDHRTEGDIVEILDYACFLVPNDSDSCKAFVQEYTHKIIEFLKNDIVSDSICGIIQICDDSNTVFGTAKMAPQVDCFICKKMAAVIQKILEKKDDQKEILNIANYTCSLLLPYKEKCQDFVKEYGQSTINLLIDVVEPDDICPMLNLCTGLDLHVTDAEIFDCAICKTVVWTMKKIVENPRANHEVKYVLEKTCRGVPPQDQKMCRGLVDKYGLRIFDMLVKKVEDKTICRSLEICAIGAMVEI